jgi:HKD family nuclease
MNIKGIQLDTITNSTAITLEHELDTHLKTAQEVFIATAFINQKTVHHLKSYLANRRHETKFLRLLVGLYGRFNSPEILIELIKLQESYKAKCEIRIARNSRFHWKCYLFDSGKKQTSFVGSANFTSSGISKSGELVVRFIESGKGVFANRLRTEFNKIFEMDSESFNISKLPLDEYKRLHRVKGFEENKEDIALSSLLKKPVETKFKVAKTSDNLKVRLVTVYGFLLQATVKTISKYKSQWHDLNYDYFCCDYYSDYKRSSIGDILFYQDKDDNGYWVYTFREVMDKDEIQTADGKYFIAVKKIRGSRSIKQSALEEKLRELKVPVVKRAPFKDKLLTNRQTSELTKLFKINLPN